MKYAYMFFALLSLVFAVFAIAGGSVCFFVQEIECTTFDVFAYFVVSMGFLIQTIYLIDLFREE